ncbi:hypothetical protein EOD42_08990 [Rhodovarius crocodyli]|uniref:Uncharacterized protein n=1 Tax=Rhodovarius crocodyli TaxID=1979269 RepID=A0A437MJZ8_9PROT|nr:hypothetical protein [Rhodovarius crocodyli]RVT97915.1 hypothetical protein EOD42_08990 [Rhodovarius crocodyli]
MSDCTIAPADDFGLYLRVLRACQGMLPIAREALRWINGGDDEVVRSVRLECVVCVAPRALRDQGTAAGLLQAAAQAEIWVLAKGCPPSPARNQKIANNTLHAPNSIRRA